MEQNQNNGRNLNEEVQNDWGRMRGWNMVQQPENLWNFRGRRAQAGGNRQNVPAQNMNNMRHGGGRGNERHRAQSQRGHGRRNGDQQETRRKDCRTAFEFDHREEQCWTRVIQAIQQNSTNFGPTSDFHIPNEFEVCANLRSREQLDTIQNAHEIINNQFQFCSKPQIQNILEKLEMHMRTSAIEYEMLEKTIGEMTENLEKANKEMYDLEDIIQKVNFMKVAQ
ncbi:unnamed protein product [Caenorhabditis angaria]|uniref:Uncharacterized protein n=1 Tax=Caenorhabditis angaria TaxID=860376 RepID=A0A9P1I299_9PELO|nr:unnamed protein product [Caenorhabditis angaria]